MSGQLSPNMQQLTAENYKNARQIPPGTVLVVGGGVPAPSQANCHGHTATDDVASPWFFDLHAPSDADNQHTWEALSTMCNLFRITAVRVAEHCGVAFPYGDDERVSAPGACTIAAQECERGILTSNCISSGRYVTRWKPTRSATRCIAGLSEAALHVARFPALRIAAVTNETTAWAYPRPRASGRVYTLATSHASSEYRQTAAIACSWLCSTTPQY